MKKFDWKNFGRGNIVVCTKTMAEFWNFDRLSIKHGIAVRRNDDMRWVLPMHGKSSYSGCYGGEPKKDVSWFWKKEDYTVVEWSDYMEFTKNDLTIGMLVETDTGRALLMPCEDDYGLAYENGGFDGLSDFCSDNIVKVWDICTNGLGALDFTGKFRDVIYERKETKEMTVEEIGKALGYNVKIVK